MADSFLNWLGSVHRDFGVSEPAGRGQSSGGFAAANILRSSRSRRNLITYQPTGRHGGQTYKRWDWAIPMVGVGQNPMHFAYDGKHAYVGIKDAVSWYEGCTGMH